MARVKRGVAEKLDAPTILSGEVKVVAVSSIRPHPENARKGNVPAIKASIADIGFYGKVLVWKETGQIVVGSHRWKAASELGMLRIPVEVVSLTERQARKILAADNRTSDLAGYDDALLAPLLERLRDSGDLGVASYADEDLEAARRRLVPPAGPGEFKDLDPGGMHLVRDCPRCGFKF